jgi:hypothetical protein
MLQQLGLRPPRCITCNKVPVHALGRRCPPCALSEAKRQGLAVRPNLPPPEPKKQKAPPVESAWTDVATATAIIGRDRRVFHLLREEFDLEPSDGGQFRVVDILVLHDVVQERAREWKRGERGRPY